jgi:hypothetical protein
MNALSVIATALLCAFGGFDDGAGRVPIDGDPALLDMLLAAQHTNLAAYPEGELTATVHTEWGEDVTDNEVSAAWQGSKSYYKYRSTYAGQGGRPTTILGEMIEDSAKATAVFYVPVAKLLIRTLNGVHQPGNFVKIRPDPTWFGFEGERFFELWLDAAKIGSTPFKPTGGRVERDGQLVTVTWKNDNGLTSRIACSLDYGGNVVSVDSTPVTEGFSGALTWDRTKDGVLYARRIEYSRGEKNNPNSVKVTQVISIDSFSPKISYLGDRFSEVSLGVPKRVRVEEYVGRKLVNRFRMGNAPRGLGQADFDLLIDSMRRSGFAAPKENE